MPGHGLADLQRALASRPNRPDRSPARHGRQGRPVLGLRVRVRLWPNSEMQHSAAIDPRRTFGLAGGYTCHEIQAEAGRYGHW
jgi:hypothetical protein